MRVTITADGQHDPPAHHIVVDGHGLLLDLDGLGSLVDPTIARVEWGPNALEGGAREGGWIIRTDGHRTPFQDRGALKPYLAAFRRRDDEIKREQAELNARLAQVEAHK